MQGFDREMGFLGLPSSSQQWTWNSTQSFLRVGDVAKGFWSCQGAVLGGQGSKASDAAWGHTLSRSRGLQVPETCNHSCTCYKECKRKSTMFQHGQSLFHFTLMEAPRTWVEMERLHQMTNSGWIPNIRLVAIVVLIFVAQNRISFHWHNALLPNREDRCVTS
jgi:hypothetical protein